MYPQNNQAIYPPYYGAVQHLNRIQDHQYGNVGNQSAPRGQSQYPPSYSSASSRSHKTNEHANKNYPELQMYLEKQQHYSSTYPSATSQFGAGYSQAPGLTNQQKNLQNNQQIQLSKQQYQNSQFTHQTSQSLHHPNSQYYHSSISANASSQPPPYPQHLVSGNNRYNGQQTFQQPKQGSSTWNFGSNVYNLLQEKNTSSYQTPNELEQSRLSHQATKLNSHLTNNQVSGNSSPPVLHSSWHRPTKTNPVLQSIPTPTSTPSPDIVKSLVSSSISPSHTSTTPENVPTPSPELGMPQMPVKQERNENIQIHNATDLYNNTHPVNAVSETVDTTDAQSLLSELDTISSKSPPKLSPKEEKRKEAALRDLKKWHRLDKKLASENQDNVFRKPKEKLKRNKSQELQKHLSPGRVCASPDSTFVPDFTKQTSVNEETTISINPLDEPPLSPLSDTTICYGIGSDEESPKLSRASGKRTLSESDNSEIVNKRIKVSGMGTTECDSTNGLIEEALKSQFGDIGSPAEADAKPEVGHVVYNELYFVRYCVRNNEKYFVSNDISVLFSTFLKALKGMMAKRYTCSESEAKMLNYKYSGSRFPVDITRGQLLLKLRILPEVFSDQLNAKYENSDLNFISCIEDEYNPAVFSLNKSKNEDLESWLENQSNSNDCFIVNDNLSDLLPEDSACAPCPYTSDKLKEKLDMFSSMSKSVIISALTSLVEECQVLKEQNVTLQNKVNAANIQTKSLEGMLQQVSILLSSSQE